VNFDEFVAGYHTDKFNGHKYLEVYKELFVPRKDSVSNVLEIGIQGGGSMQLWHDFFENAHIYGIDVVNLPDWYIVTERMTHILSDAYNTELIDNRFLNKVQFDIIIDDGPHTLASMIFVAQHYSKLLSDTGVLIIEDIPDINWTKQIISSFPKELQSKARAVDNRYIQNRWDDILVVLEK